MPASLLRPRCREVAPCRDSPITKTAKSCASTTGSTVGHSKSNAFPKRRAECLAQCVGATTSRTLSMEKKGLDECGAVFDLVEIRPVRGSATTDQGHTDGIRAELRDKAAMMRAATT